MQPPADGRKITWPEALSAVLMLVWCLACSSPLSAQGPSDADAILGTWVVAEKDAYIEIYRQDHVYFGRIAWLADAPNPEARTGAGKSAGTMYEEPRIGMVIVRDFRFDGHDWRGGTLYDPTDGKTYKGILSLDRAGRLRVRGFVGISLLGKTTVWQRVR